MGRVFVPEMRLLDEAEAERIGEVVTLVASSNCLGLEPDSIKRIMENPLHTYRNGDFLLLDGRSVHCAVAASILATTRNVVDLLVWDKLTNTYLTRPLTFFDVPQPKAVLSNIRAHIVNDMKGISERLTMTSIVLGDGHDPVYMEPESTKTQMLEHLKDSHKQDYLVMSGSKMQNVVASSIMARMHGRVNYLILNAKTDKYEHRSATF